FEVRFGELSSFGGRKPRAIVVGVEPIQPLVELQAELERLMQRLGLEPEGRKFTPHVTLARLRDASSRDVADYLSTRGPMFGSSFQVSRFVLFSSRASVGGGPYVVEADYPLAACAGFHGAREAHLRSTHDRAREAVRPDRGRRPRRDY